MTDFDRMSYAAIHRIAVREADRVLLGQALGEIERATHAVVGRRCADVVYSYGDLRACEAFADGIEREVLVVKMDDATKERLGTAKVKAFRRARP